MNCSSLVFVVIAMAGNVTEEVLQFRVNPGFPAEVVFRDVGSDEGKYLQRMWETNDFSKRVVVDAPCREGEVENCSTELNYEDIRFVEGLIDKIISYNDSLGGYKVDQIKIEDSLFRCID